jgi:hypothetical protein
VHPDDVKIFVCAVFDEAAHEVVGRQVAARQGLVHQFRVSVEGFAQAFEVSFRWGCVGRGRAADAVRGLAQPLVHARTRDVAAVHV